MFYSWIAIFWYQCWHYCLRFRRSIFKMKFKYGVKMYLSFLGQAWANPTLAWSTGTHASTDRPCPSHSHDTDTLHVSMLACCKAMPHLRSCARVVVNSAVRSDDSYKTANMDNGKVKSWDTRATNCETGTRERTANLFILVLPCRCRHPWLSHTSVFLLVTLHKPFFTLLH